MTRQPTALRAAFVTAVVAAALAVTATVWALWSTSALGAGGAGTARMPAGPQPVAVVEGAAVAVTWSAVRVAGDDVAGYRVTRHDAATGAPAPVGPGCAGTTTALTCTETDVPGGDWRYAVTPLQNGWSGVRGALSEPVRVERTVTLALQPSAAAPGATTTVTGAGFRPAEDVVVRAGEQVLTTVVADADGRLAPADVTVPDLPFGPVSVEARGGAGDRVAVAVLDVLARVSADPAVSRGGLTTTLHAAGLPALAPVTVTGAAAAGSTTSDVAGRASLPVRLPLRPAGPQAVTVSAAGASASTTVDIVPGLTLSAPAVAAGDSVIVSADGLAADADVVLQLAGAAPVTTRTDDAGTLAATRYPVPADAPAGAAELVLDDGAGTVLRAAVQVSAVTLTLDPGEGAPGTALTVTGTGWPAGEVDVMLGGVPVCSPVAQADGAFSASCEVPERRAGAQPVRATAGSVVAVAGFTVVPGIVPAGTTGSPGGRVSVTAAGFAGSSPLSADLDGRALDLAVTTDGAGSASFGVTLPDDAEPGVRLLRVVDATGNAAVVPLTLLGATLSVTPSVAAPGDVVRVSGTAWPAGDGAVSVRVGLYQVCTPTPDATGAFAADCTLPDLPGGTAPTTATRGAVTAEGGAFTVRPVVVLTPATTSPGASVAVSGRGFTAGTSPLSLRFGGEPVPVAAKGTSSSGSFAGLGFPVPASTPAGSHAVEVRDPEGRTAQAVLVVAAPEVTLSASSGAPNTTVGATGSGWPALSSVTVAIGGSSACTVTTTASGTFSSSSCRVPVVAGGTRPVIARTGGVSSPTTSFEVLPTVTPSSRNLSPGSPVSLNAYGLPASQPVVASIGGLDVGTLTAGSNGFTSKAVTVPDLPAGSHVVQVPGAEGRVAEADVTVFRPTLSASVHEVVPGQTSLRLTGSGWPASAAFTPKVGIFQLCPNVATRADGTVDAPCSVGSLPGGPGQVLTGSSGPVTARDPQTVTVLPGLRLGSVSGAAGRSVPVTGQGLRPGPASLTFDGAVVASGSVSSSGLWTPSLPVPADAAPGAHEVAVVQADAPSPTATYTVVAAALVSPTAPALVGAVLAPVVGLAGRRAGSRRGRRGGSPATVAGCSRG